MNSISWTKKQSFYMNKLSYEVKVNIYQEKGKGETRTILSKKYSIKKANY